VRAWVDLSERFGKLPFGDLFEPAIRYAPTASWFRPPSRGCGRTRPTSCSRSPGFADAFIPRGRAPEPGEKFAFRAQAKTLQRIAETRGEAFYTGELAEKIAAFAKQHGGAMTLEDLAAHANDWVEPMGLDYHGYTLHEIPPNGQGIAALIALGILEHLDIPGHASRFGRQHCTCRSRR
jgi:gamma-glutamyltranspeptidase / glutathione hydrolase